jgi:hypothetical protein
VQDLQEASDTALVNEITKHTDERQALRWLARELAWENVLTGLRDEDEAPVDEVPAARAA